MPASQAGRRRFEPGLPLHLFNNLASPEFKACSKMLQKRSDLLIYITTCSRTGAGFIIDCSNASTATLRRSTFTIV